MVDTIRDPQAKKRKKSQNAVASTAQPAKAGPSKTPSTARLFQPFRALGYVTNHIPFTSFVHNPRGAFAKPTINIVTSVGKSWMMWDAERMTLVFVGKEGAEDIRGLAMTGIAVFASSGSRVTKYERGQEVREYHRREGGRAGADSRHGFTKRQETSNWAGYGFSENNCWL
jgi:U3 small nucleolar RNA-associated protein 21